MWDRWIAGSGAAKVSSLYRRGGVGDPRAFADPLASLNRFTRSIGYCHPGLVARSRWELRRSRSPRSLVRIVARVWPPRQRECVRGRHQPPAGILFQGITALHAAPPAGTIRPPPPGADTALPAHRPPRRDLACRAEPRGQAGGGLRRGRTAGLSPLRHPQFRFCPSAVRFLRPRFFRGPSLGDCKKPCKGRGICPSCNGRRMAQTTARLVDHVIPPVPVRQWVVSVPKRLRWFLGERSAAVAAITRIFMSEVQRRVRHRRRVYQDRDG